MPFITLLKETSSYNRTFSGKNKHTTSHFKTQRKTFLFIIKMYFYILSLYISFYMEQTTLPMSKRGLLISKASDKNKNQL